MCLSSIHRPRPGADESLDEDDPERYIPGLPVVSFRLTDEFMAENPHIKQAAVSTLLRVKGWILPNYPLPPNQEKTEILRVVVRESFSSSTTPPFDLMTDEVCVIALLRMLLQLQRL